MLSVELKKHDNDIWYLHYSSNGRSKRVSTRATDRRAAERVRADFIHAAGQTAPAGAHLTVAELWKRYDEKHIERNTAAPDSLRNAWKNLGPFFGNRTPPDITQTAVDDYEAARARGTIGRPSKPATVRKELNALRACLNWCADKRRKIITPDTVPEFDMPPDSAPRDRWLRTNEIQRLLDAARTLRPGSELSRGELFLWLALETAARKTAILTLTWDRVDFETKVIHYKDPDRPETKKRRANVPISASLLPILQRAYFERRTDLVMGTDVDIWGTVQSIAERAGFGERATRKAAGAAVATRKSGSSPPRTGISPHVLRHTAATHMARRGVPLFTISKVLGNTVSMVERVYAKHCPDDLRDAVGLISKGELVALPWGISAQNEHQTSPDDAVQIPDSASQMRQTGRRTAADEIRK